MGDGTVFVTSPPNLCRIGFVKGGFMSGIVIPIKELSPTELAAVRFALEYSKRSRARLFFLFVEDPDSTPFGRRGRGPRDSSMDREAIRRAIDSLIARDLAQGEPNMEVHKRRGDFIQEVRQFIRDNHVDEIVMSVSDEIESADRSLQQDIQLLAQMTHCRVLTVKPKSLFEGSAHPDR